MFSSLLSAALPVIRKDKGTLLASVPLQLGLALLFGHYYDMRIFMATGYLVASGQNPYAAQDLSRLFNNPAFQGITTIGYPSPWALVLGLIYRLSYPYFPNLLIYNLLIKLPILAANLCLAGLTVGILIKMGTEVEVCRKAWRVLILSPFLLYFSTAWGQFDVIVALLALSALALLDHGKLTASALLLAAAISFKPIALPLLPVAGIHLLGKSNRQALQFFTVCLGGMALFCIVPFAIFGWNPDPILRGWNAHFTVGGGMSWMTFYELLKDSYQLPGAWWLLGLAWVLALAIAIVIMRPGISGFEDLLMKSTAVLLVFFLTRAWLSEPNVILVFPLVLILTATGRLKAWAFHALWILPLVFTLFNASLPQLFFPSMPGVMEKLLKVAEEYRTFRLVVKIVVVIPWQITGWWIVINCFRRRPLPAVMIWK
jgi:hypothetical protein